MGQSLESIDFSQESIRKAVRNKVVDSPLVVYPTAAGILGGLSMFVFDPTLFLIVGAAGLFVLGLGALGVNIVFRRPVLENIYVRKLHKLLEQKMEQSVENLEKDLESLQLTEGSRQLSRLKEKLENLVNVIHRRFKDGELTQTRYLGTANQVYLAGLDNLNEMVVAAQSISEIDSSGVAARLAKLKKSSPSPEEQSQVEALSERVRLFNDQQKKIKTLLTQNELAMTALDNTAVALANVKTSAGHAEMGADDAMKALADLAKRASNYAA